MQRDDVIEVLCAVIEEDGSDEAVRQIVDAGGDLSAEVALVETDMTVSEALLYAEGLIALGRDVEAAEVIAEAVRGAFHLPLVAAA